MHSKNQEIRLPLLSEKGITIHIKREDRIHPLISGNKYRKLKYNLAAVKESNIKTLLTYGGAYSNHIAAVAFAGKKEGLETIGVVRGEELQDKWQDNPTLTLANAHGMHFIFVSREKYRNKMDRGFQKELMARFGPFYSLPEGGTNTLAVTGCEEILTPEDARFNVIGCSVGTGGTLAGLINASRGHQHILGFPAVKGDFLQEDIRKFAPRGNWSLQTAYTFGGYAKVPDALIEFINVFYQNTGIPLDPIYTGKMMFGILEMVRNNRFKANTRILAIHTGGLQGIEGMNQKLTRQGRPPIRFKGKI
ncbi:MAG: pyridoxal-phosphate dependent enzyme [Bacteroidota bacterium]